MILIFFHGDDGLLLRLEVPGPLQVLLPVSYTGHQALPAGDILQTACGLLADSVWLCPLSSPAFCFLHDDVDDGAVVAGRSAQFAGDLHYHHHHYHGWWDRLDVRADLGPWMDPENGCDFFGCFGVPCGPPLSNHPRLGSDVGLGRYVDGEGLGAMNVVGVPDVVVGRDGAGLDVPIRESDV